MPHRANDPSTPGPTPGLTPDTALGRVPGSTHPVHPTAADLPPPHSHHRSTRRAVVAAAAALALILAACGDDSDPTEEAVGGQDEEVELDELDELDDLGDLEGLDAFDDLDTDLIDPNELVVDGRFAANGVVLPAPEGWSFDPFAFASGIALATAPEGIEQLAAEAVDPAELPEELTFDDVLDANRAAVDATPDVDTPFDVAGAARAVQLRYLDLASSSEQIAAGQPETTSLLLIIAEREDGVLGLFNYAAASEDFDDDVADLLLETAGFDPDSDPSPAQPLG